MLKTIELENAVTHLFRGEELSTLGMEIMSELDLERLIQSIRHHAEPVYAYRADTCEDSGCNYRGELLFPCPATLLYSMPYVKADSDSGVSFTRRSELWLLEDMSFAVVANARVQLCDGDFVSEYRCLKTKDLDIFPQVIDLDLNLLAMELAAMCEEYLDSPMPTYEI